MPETVVESRYVRIAQTLEEEIVSDHDDGMRPKRLPSERTLAERFGYQRSTVREALQLLAARGLIYRKDRSGWYVSPPRLLYNPTMPLPLSEITQQQGRELLTEVITTDEEGQPECRIPSAKFLALRRRSLDGLPVLIERIYMQERIRQELASADLTESIADLLDHQPGVRITHERLTLNSTAMAPDLASLLYTTAGAPVFEIERMRYDEDQLLSVDIELWRPQAVHVTIETNWLADQPVT
ncbi:MAG: UTRA domain-containing protein [Actinobacteria bacterium]|nr:UTRA domain-containing protein [Actinomycetota bacterium]